MMKTFWQVVYTLLLFPLFRVAVRGVATFNRKLATSIAARETLFDELEAKIKKIPSGKKRILFHAASVGEFEQARPLIQALRQHADVQIFVSFLSPSGYNARKSFADADLVCYLPEDTPANAKRFFDLLKPDVWVLMRYDFWFNHLAEAHRQNVRLILASAVMRRGSLYAWPIGRSFYTVVFGLFDKIFTVSQRDAAVFRKVFGIDGKIEQAGDTRFDQVIFRSQLTQKVSTLSRIYAGKRVLVCGSTWPKDEALVLAAFAKLGNQNVHLILAPHEVGTANIARLEALLAEQKFSSAKVSSLSNDFSGDGVLIIDQIGYLAELYSIAGVAYIGGGFGTNVHNTLEAAVFGIPVIMGPNITKSAEAKSLVQLEAAFIVTSEEQLAERFHHFFTDEAARISAGEKAKAFVFENAGATRKVIAAIDAELGLPAQEKSNGVLNS
jgi:3-deoxy-D-manno-octulosonic-acid transferase